MGKLVTLLLVGLAIACSPPRPADAPVAPIDPTRLSHAHHAQIPCIGCHRGEARPGSDDHRPCDDNACHHKDFLAKPGLFCRVCHQPIEASPVVAKLRPYPSDDAWESEPARFDHRLHLDRTKMERAVGFHVACEDCHARDDAGLARPNHATCGRCHAPEAKLKGAPNMAEGCVGCHVRGAQERTRHRLIKEDLHFNHLRHHSDRKGQSIPCEQCHLQTADSTGFADHPPPRVENCVACHDDTDRVPESMRMRICETCHAERTATLTKLAPRSHLPVTERPLDHTLAFRRDHAEVAERNPTRCAGCHTQMSGNPRAACDECHQTMKPADHRITWRELDHGPDAEADRDRCARCHVVEFCSTCHAQRPRSHGPSGSFNHDHFVLARINLRACLTCHTQSAAPPTGCAGTGCHR